jgi:hypothetical protein
MLQQVNQLEPTLQSHVTSEPEIACGYWWSDKWCSPYLRGRFNINFDAPELRLKARNPEIRNRPSFLRVRVGTRNIAEYLDVEAGEWIDTVIPLSAYAMDAETLDISLRFDASWRPENGDIRDLGALLFDWRVTAAKTQD